MASENKHAVNKNIVISLPVPSTIHIFEGISPITVPTTTQKIIQQPFIPFIVPLPVPSDLNV